MFKNKISHFQYGTFDVADEPLSNQRKFMIILVEENKVKQQLMAKIVEALIPSQQIPTPANIFK